MFFLLLAIICSVCLLLVFKFIEPRGISKLQVIIVNYFTAAAIGAITTPGRISFNHFISQTWFPLAILLGMIFICVFYCVAASTQLNGVAITSVAFKLSLVIPVVAAYFLYHDAFSFLKITGIVLALIAILLTSRDGSNSQKAQGFVSYLPVIVFIGSGISDAIFNFIQKKYLTEPDFSSFFIILFLTAGSGGCIALLLSFLKNKNSFQPAALLTGIVLGIPNYGSAYFMMLALERSRVEASALWPLNNIGIIILSTVSATALFDERINKYGIAGIIVAIVSILLITFAFL